jgi:DNA modification methylase
MSILLHGDCLELMKDLDDNSIDLIFCDLPYGQTSCKWDCPIDLDIFWLEVMRIKKLNTPIFMTTTTKFGVSLINSAPKKCHFRYDIVWVKSSPAGFLSAKKMPMRKHEMIYVFYEKLPFYDLSSHTHKFIKEGKKSEGDKGNECYGKFKYFNNGEKGYDPPLPVSVVKEETGGATGEELSNNKDFSVEVKNSTYGTLQIKQPITSGARWEPPLPVSVVKEEPKQIIKGEHNTYNTEGRKKPIVREKGDKYDPPLPNSMLEIKSTRGKHSTEKPVALMEWVLKYYSREGDTILDPTMGSGSTGVACKNMNRNFIGIEKDPEIYEVAVNRIEG